MQINKRNKNIFFLSVLIVYFFGCKEIISEEIARIPVNSVSSEDSLIIREVNVYLHAKDIVSFWTEMDIEFEGELFFEFQIKILKDSIVMGGLKIDPFKKEMTINELKRTVLNKTKWRFTGKNATIGIPEDGNYTFEAILISNQNNSLKVNKAEIILKK